MNEAKTELSIEDLPDLVQLIKDERRKSRTPYPVKSVWASQVGHPCKRFLCYHQAISDERPEADDTLLGIFRRGKVVGEDASIEVARACRIEAIEVGGNESPIPQNQFNIGGKVDYDLRIPSGNGRPHVVPVEQKSMNQFTFDQIPDGNTEAQEWFINHRTSYLRCYPSQLLTYMYFTESPVGIMLIRNASTFADRQVNWDLDYGRMEELLQVSDDVNHIVRQIRQRIKDDKPWEDLLPTRLDYEPDVCGRCDFRMFCIPDIMGAPGILISDDDVLDQACRDCWEMDGPRKLYENQNNAIKSHLKMIFAKEEIEVGQGKVIATKGFAIMAKQGKKSISKRIVSLEEFKNEGGVEPEKETKDNDRSN